MKTMKSILLLCLVGVVSSVSSAALVEWSDDFETANTDWYTYYTGRATAQAYEGSWSMSLGNYNGREARRSIGDVSSGTFEVTFAFFATGTDGPGDQWIGVRNGTVYADYQTKLSVTLDNDPGKDVAYIRAYDGATAGAAIELNRDTWYEVKLVVSPDVVNGGTYDFYLKNDQDQWDMKASGYEFNQGVTSSSLYFGANRVVKDSNLAAYIDNVNVTASVPEPATMSLLGLGGLITVFRKKK